MAPLAGIHHHRSTTKISQKQFKSRHQTKGALKEKAKGKIDTHQSSQKRQTPHQQVMSKIDRRHQARQKQQLKKKQHLQRNNIFSSKNGAPRNVAIVPLCATGDLSSAINSLNTSVDEQGEVNAIGISHVEITRFRQKLQYVAIERDFSSALITCRSADFVVFVLSADSEVDELGESILRAVESQGISNVYFVVQHLDVIQPFKARNVLLSSLKSYVSRFFPAQEKLYSLDSSQECSNIMRTLCTATPKGVRWRENRSWMLVEDVRWVNDQDAQTCGAVITGVIRGKNLNANRLIQITGWGDFQVDKITAAAPRGRTETDSTINGEGQEESVLALPSNDQDDLASLAPEEAVMLDLDENPQTEDSMSRKGVLLDDHYYFDEDDPLEIPRPQKLPKGTSDYQSAWFLDDVSDSGSDISHDEHLPSKLEDESFLPQDGMEGLTINAETNMTDAAFSEAPLQSEAFLDPSPNDEADQIAAFRSRNANETDDLEFPDEIELQPNVLARERLARYRGLKSLRTSRWETSEDKAHQPMPWPRLLQIPDYKASKSQVTREALVGGVELGRRVCIHLSNVPSRLRESHSKEKPLLLVSLLRHEHKNAVLNFSITLSSSCTRPIKSKDELVIQVANRRFVINPIFSPTSQTANNVHKFMRYLYPGHTAVASFIGPMTWGSVPVVFLKAKPSSSSGSSMEMIGTGTSLPPDSERVIAKRAILTGHPYKIHKNVVTVRYMFFNAADVNWFKALQLFTKRGRSGHIKESLGTHGYFKATFDGKINPQDSVGISLYKRVWPRQARLLNEFEPNIEPGSNKEMELD